MPLLKHFFESPHLRNRRKLFESVAHQHKLTAVADLNASQKLLQKYTTLQPSRLREVKVFSCWQSQSSSIPYFQLFDYGTVSAGGGWQWTVLCFASPIPDMPDFVITGKGWLDKASAKLGISKTVNLSAPIEFQKDYTVYSSEQKKLAKHLSFQKLKSLHHLPLPQISTIESKNGAIIYQQSLNFKSSNHTAFNPRQAKSENVTQIIREGVSVYQLLSEEDGGVQ